MKNLFTIRTAVLVLVVALALLSVAAGLPKILQMPQELEFLGAIGFSPVAVTLLGVLQFISGVLLVWKKTRLPGLVIASICLLLSSIALFVGGNVSFGQVSLLPFAIAVFLIVHVTKNQNAP